MKATMDTANEKIAPPNFRNNSFSGLEVWPESHWPGFALRQADVFQYYTAW